MKDKLNTKSLFIALTGKPNVGKSSVLNMILGRKTSIVSPKPQTTRNRITGIFTDKDIQLVFTDTPGRLKVKSELDKYMEKEITETVLGAEACLHVTEAGKDLSYIDIEIINNLKSLDMPVILALNKIDLLKRKSILINQMQSFIEKFPYSAIVPVSAKTNEGKDCLIGEMKKLAVPSVFFFPEDQTSDQNECKLVSEIIREKALRLLNEEVPHGIAVYVDDIKRRSNNILDINSSIYCEREGHKGIIIGKNGLMLKKIGSYSREDIEKLLECRVNLKIWVKVKKDWKNKGSLLRALGYN